LRNVPLGFSSKTNPGWGQLGFLASFLDRFLGDIIAVLSWR
jgi:hypothetical protein